MSKPSSTSFVLDPNVLQLLESAPDAIVTVNHGGEITYVNSQFIALFGRPSQAVLGQPVEILIPERYRGKHPFHRIGFAKDPKVRPMGQGLPLFGLHANGNEFPVEISLSPWEAGQERLIIAAIRDVTKQKESEEMFRGLLEAAPDATVILEAGGTIKLINAQTEKLFGYFRDELVGKHLEVLIPERFRGTHPGLRQSYLDAPRVRPMGEGLELFARHKDGNELPVEISLTPLETRDGLLIMAALRDVTERKRLHEQLMTFSITDQLTGLLNRRGFIEVGGKLREIAKRTQAALILIMIDVDRLKEINDAFGHSSGDECIQDIALVLEKSIRSSDVISRWGGDEFLVLAMESNGNSPEIIRERIRANLDDFKQQHKREYQLSISMGVAVSDPQKDEPLDQLIDIADHTMYQEKGAEK